MTPELFHIPYSPWSERARWVLDLGDIQWRSRPFLPTISEPRLRWKLRRPRGKVTVPVLFTEQGPLTDSWDIATWVEARRPGTLPDGTRHLNELAEQALRSGRRLAGARVLSNPEALLGSRPGFAVALGPLGTKLTADGWKRIMGKYKESALSVEDHRSRQIDTLDELQEAVGDGPFVFDTVSYADITVASALAFVAPHPRLGLHPATARAWGDPALHERFAPLIRWRDTVVAAHR